MTPERAVPEFRDLDANEMNELLERNHVGRLAYSFHDRVDIEPIGYVFADDAVYMRTTPGSKLTTLAHAPWVALEVDEVRGPFDWRSVVVRGTVYVMRETGSAADRAAYRNAVKRLRELVPEALTDEDPTPVRRVLVKLYPTELTGKAAQSSARHRTEPPAQAGQTANTKRGKKHAPDSARRPADAARPRARERRNARSE